MHRETAHRPVCCKRDSSLSFWTALLRLSKLNLHYRVSDRISFDFQHARWATRRLVFPTNLTKPLTRLSPTAPVPSEGLAGLTTVKLAVNYLVDYRHNAKQQDELPPSLTR